MLENGREVLEMATENSHGLMVLSILESGGRTELTEKADLFMLMVISMMASGLMIKQMATEFISM